VGAVLSSSARAQSDVPPPLQTVSSQFIELRPAVEAPAQKLERIDGKFICLTEFHGKAVLMCFWATWCPPCRRELPLLERLQTLVDRRRLEIVAVSIDKAGKPAVNAFLKSVNVTHLRPYLDPQGEVAGHADQDAKTPFLLYGMPISYLIDRRGRVTGYITGEVDWASEEGLAFLRYYMDA
jgi:thiol-disulfide isomerase/thioredoxin